MGELSISSNRPAGSEKEKEKKMKNTFFPSGKKTFTHPGRLGSSPRGFLRARRIPVSDSLLIDTAPFRTEKKENKIFSSFSNFLIEEKKMFLVVALISR